MKKKKILLLSDDIRSPSGVGIMSRQLVLRTSNVFNWVQLAGTVTSPEAGRRIDISEGVNKITNQKDTNVVLYPVNGFGNWSKLKKLLANEKPDCILLFTDLHRWIWFFEKIDIIKKHAPVCFLNIWDAPPTPVWNKPQYSLCDGLFGISYQTHVFNQEIVGTEDKKRVFEYIPHGVCENTFTPLELNDSFTKAKTKLLQSDKYDFIVFFNSKSMNRKRPDALIKAFGEFCKKLTKEQADTCLLLIKEAKSVDPLDYLPLSYFIDTYCKEYNVRIIDEIITPEQLNFLYNISSITVQPSYFEGWGLSVTESMLAGTMVMPTVTGGLQDQCGFTDNAGRRSFTYTVNHGKWAIPLQPDFVEEIHTPSAPIIEKHLVSVEQIAQGLLKCFKLPSDNRRRYGIEGRKWAVEVAGHTAASMSSRLIRALTKVIDNCGV